MIFFVVFFVSKLRVLARRCEEEGNSRGVRRVLCECFCPSEIKGENPVWCFVELFGEVTGECETVALRSSGLLLSSLTSTVTEGEAESGAAEKEPLFSALGEEGSCSIFPLWFSTVTTVSASATPTTWSGAPLTAPRILRSSAGARAGSLVPSSGEVHDDEGGDGDTASSSKCVCGTDCCGTFGLLPVGWRTAALHTVVKTYSNCSYGTSTPFPPFAKSIGTSYRSTPSATKNFVMSVVYCGRDIPSKTSI